MTSTSFNVGINTATRNSSKVLKPPGGGSSDIFGSGDSGEPQRRGRNHNISSFSLGGEEVAAPARKPGNDSFYNLFGTNEPQSRPSTAVKDKFRSNITLDQTDGTSTTAKKTLFDKDNCTDKEISTTPNNNGECVESVENEKNGNEPSCDGSEEVQAVKEVEEELTRTETPSNETPDVAPVSESVSTNGSTSSTESTPAPTPTPTASAPNKQRVPPGGFSSGLW